MGGLQTGIAGRLAVVVAAGAVALGTALVVAGPAHADEPVTVQGTAFPSSAEAKLSFVGCADLYQRSDEPVRPWVGRGPGDAPRGERSLGFSLGGGNAVGALYFVDSMHATTTASLAVSAAGRASGVAYAGYQEPADAGTSLLWLGRSELATPGGAWQTVEATTRSYVWTKYDMTTRQRVAEGPGTATTVPAFIASRGGDGPGLYTIGFGCDGTPFSMDEMRVGRTGSVATYDLEGLRTRVTIDADADGAVRPGAEVAITGRLATGTGAPVPHATMVLEKREPGSSRWAPVRVAEVGPDGARVTVTPSERTEYRWRFVDRPLAEGSTSAPLLVDVLLPTTTPTPTPDPSPGPTAPGDPTGGPSGGASTSPGGPSDPGGPGDVTSDQPVPSASSDADASQSAVPATEPSPADLPTPTATPEGTSSAPPEPSVGLAD